ncbi:MAG TPA: UMP kinase [bacterium]|nr:UMP kinase [bacterium]
MLYVLSLGGSIVSLQEGLNTNFLKKFKKLIEARISLGDKFIIVVGGGNLARKYIKGAVQIKKDIDDVEKDYLGIYATFLNARLVKSAFGELAEKNLLLNPNIKINFKKPVAFSGGYLPGNSSDFVAVSLAKTYQADIIINLSNIDYVYDKDPNKFSEAKKIKKINWKNFLEIIGDKWSPGMSAPFDPVASKFCQKNNKKVIVLNGQKIKNLENYFLNNKFQGTEIY